MVLVLGACSSDPRFTITLDRSAWEAELKREDEMRLELRIDRRQTTYAWPSGRTRESFTVLGRESAVVEAAVTDDGPSPLGGSAPLLQMQGSTLCILGPQQLSECLAEDDPTSAQACGCRQDTPDASTVDSALGQDGGSKPEPDASDAACAHDPRGIEVIGFDQDGSCLTSLCTEDNSPNYDTSNPKCGSAALAGGSGGIYMSSPAPELKSLTGLRFWLRPDPSAESRKQMVWFANYGGTPTVSTWLAELYVFVSSGRVGIEIQAENGNSFYCSRFEATRLQAQDWVEVELFLTDRGNSDDRPNWVVDASRASLAVAGRSVAPARCQDASSASPSLGDGVIDDSAEWYLGQSPFADNLGLRGDTAIDHFQFLGPRL